MYRYCAHHLLLFSMLILPAEITPYAQESGSSASQTANQGKKQAKNKPGFTLETRTIDGKLQQVRVGQVESSCSAAGVGQCKACEVTCPKGQSANCSPGEAGRER